MEGMKKMVEDSVKKTMQQFRKTYLDTVKHQSDIEGWVKLKLRKGRDLRKSLRKLNSKYEKLCYLKEQIDYYGINEYELIPDNGMSLIQIREEIDKLNNSLNKENSDSKTNINLGEIIEIIDSSNSVNDFITEVPNNYGYYLYCKELQKGYFRRKLDKMVIKFSNARKNIYHKLHNIKRSFMDRRNNNKEPKKKVGKISAIFMAGLLAISSGITAGESNTSTIKNTGNEKQYIDTNTKENSFKKSIAIQTLEKNTAPSTAQEKNKRVSNKSTNQKQRYKQNKESIIEMVSLDDKNGNQLGWKDINELENKNGRYILKANEWYTENALGGGASGYVSKDTIVNVYNRAIVKKDSNGNSVLVYVTKPGQNWEEYAEEQGYNYEEFIKDFRTINKKEKEKELEI